MRLFARTLDMSKLTRELPFLFVALAASAPAWIVKYPPIQDLPYHVATIRVLHSFHDAAFAFDQHFQLQLGNTHYLLYYVVGSLLAYAVGVTYANVVLMSAYFAGTVLSVRSLLKSMGRDPRGSLLIIPLLSNVLFIYGLLPFLLGIPLMFWGISVALRHFRRPRWQSGSLLCVIVTLCFYTHIIPFGLLGLAAVATFPWLRPRRWLVATVPWLPAVGLFSWWTLSTDAGQTTRNLLIQPQSSGVRKLDVAFNEIPQWFMNVFRDTTDEGWLIGFLALVLICSITGLGQREKLLCGARRYGFVPLACLVFYFTTPVGHDFIWPLAQRFVVLFALTSIPLIPFPQGWRGHLVAALALIVAGGVTYNTSKHFVEFQWNEVGDFDEAKKAISPAHKVCTLIYDKGSTVTHHQPFIHFGSWVQAEKGGVMMFTFAGYPHWLFDFQKDKYPPPGGPARRRWEWTPERVSSHELFPYYDFVLVRGSGFRPQPGQFERVYDGERWNVWKRIDGR